MNLQDFYQGTCFDAYQWMGAFVGPGGVTFRTYAPNADGVDLMLYHPGDTKQITMNKGLNGQFFEITVPDAKAGDLYEYRIYHDGTYTDHCDPYGRGMELRPKHCSVVRDMQHFDWTDDKWMAKRTDCKEGPLNIYEMHMGAWKVNETPTVLAMEDGTLSKEDAASIDDTDRWLRYDQVATLLAPYLEKSGYNYVEFLPLAEHPADESWGYQNTGFYAPTSRYGTADDLKLAIDILHSHNIGVIMDFVPVHFAKDGYALTNYDGTQLYELPSSDVSDSEWGTCNFIHARGEIRSFLQSAANYWLDEYHFDGLRMDAISRIIYWMGDENRGVNDRAVDFVKEMNAGLKSLHPTAFLSAEDSTNFPNVTKPVSKGGLGYDFKWDMGWMHDTLEYFQSWPSQRSDRYHKLTFSMMYYYNENYILPYSHDENVHGKATILNKMDGLYEGKFPQARAMYMYMMTHPGKKLNFMGAELGMMREFDEKRQLDWGILKYPIHDAFYHYICELNHMYLTHPALYEWDFKNEGFNWLDCHQESRCLYAFSRTNGKEHIAIAFNFSGEEQKDFTLHFASPIKAKILLHSEWEQWGGTIAKSEEGIAVKNGQDLVLDMPAESAVMIEILPDDGKDEKVKEKQGKKGAKKAGK